MDGLPFLVVEDTEISEISFLTGRAEHLDFDVGSGGVFCGDILIKGSIEKGRNGFLCDVELRQRIFVDGIAITIDFGFDDFVPVAFARITAQGFEYDVFSPFDIDRVPIMAGGNMGPLGSEIDGCRYAFAPHGESGQVDIFFTGAVVDDVECAVVQGEERVMKPENTSSVVFS